MSELEINDDLVGQRVRNPARPEWGDGTVLRVQAVTTDGRPAHRVSVQFATGHRTLMLPPGRLVAAAPEPQRAADWLDQAARRTLDDRLVELPADVREFLGTSSQRLIVLARLYEWPEDAASLLRWARSQTGVADPLAHWTRDELRAAFGEFCRRRDRLLREVAGALRSALGTEGLQQALLDVPDAPRERMQALVL